jgi:hypothetical protein
MGLSFGSSVTLRSESRGTNDHILLSQIRDSPDLDAQVAVIISPRNRVAGLHPKEQGSIFVVSYDSQGYGGGIRPRLQTWSPNWPVGVLVTQPRVGPHRKTRLQLLLYCFVCSLPSNGSLRRRRTSVFTVPLPSNGWRFLLSYSVIS